MRAEGSAVGERDAIRRFAARYPYVGDDCAVVSDRLLLASDAVVEGVDFRPGTPLADVGWRAVAVNVSDVAAMGGVPDALLVTVVGPPSTDLDALYAGVDEACAAYGCVVVGGDLSNGTELVVSIAITGRAERPVLRSGAEAGDGLWVSGPLGGAAASGYTRRPMPPAALGPQLALLGATAMIDVSDGLGVDLAHLLDASGVGAEVGAGAVPVADGATEEQAWTGGDDYALLFTLPAGVVAPDGCVRIGTIVADVASRPPAAVDGGAGWQHRFS
jgi:thiamine-monophosphate kinase